jgi:hypothetical protein
VKIKMDIKQIRSKKSLKLITLLLTALMIAGVSATTYYSMTISGTITVSSPKVVWVKGMNPNATVSISGPTATVTLSAVNGTPQNFTYCLYLENEANHPYMVNFTVTSALSTTDFSTAEMLIYTNSTGAYINNPLDLTKTSSPSVDNTLPSGATGVYTLVFDITPITIGTHSFAVKMTYQ